MLHLIALAAVALSSASGIQAAPPPALTEVHWVATHCTSVSAGAGAAWTATAEAMAAAARAMRCSISVPACWLPKR